MKARDVALFFVLKDTDNTGFTQNLVNKNDRTFYDGNARLNKFLHLAQNIYLAKYGELLYDDDLLAYDNGGVVQEVHKGYGFLLHNKQKLSSSICITEQAKSFLNVFYDVFKNASLDELIQLSHEDESWVDKHKYGSYLKLIKMDTAKYAEQYKKQYSDILQVMDGLGA